VVERLLAKEKAVSSNLIARSAEQKEQAKQLALFFYPKPVAQKVILPIRVATVLGLNPLTYP
jgi:hypothetical protein